MTYAEERRAVEAAARAGEEHVYDTVLAKLRSILLENDHASGRSSHETTYRKGWNEGLGELQRWLEKRQPTGERT